MFFVFGISQGKKMLDYAKTVICAQCGGYGRYQVFMTYSYFSLFFIPIIKWNRHYYVQMSCCSTVYELDPEVGKRLGHPAGTGSIVKPAGMRRKKILSTAPNVAGSFNI